MIPHFAARPDLRSLFVIAAILFVASEAASDGPHAQQPDPDFFERRIQPVLAEHCYECHSSQAAEIEGGLRLDYREHMLVGGDTGPAVVPGDTKASLLLQALRYEDLEMPPAGQLPGSIVADFEQWIRSGAVVTNEKFSPLLRHEFDYAEARKFWAFQPVNNPSLPAVDNRDWPHNGIDYFVLSELEGRGLTPAKSASPRELARRVYFNLIGLPPTPTQIEMFVNDSSPWAYEKLIDTLLSSPRYGERCAQHWLDVVRYAESEGFEYDRKLQGAWRFRDYVIESFNNDKPYDAFITEQLAGDELEPANRTSRIAAGFHRFGAVRRNAGNQKVASSRNEVLIERTDIVGAAFLGLTVGCARCHDHKFDPISQRDYYRLQAFFAASHEDNVILASKEQRERWERSTQRIQKQIDKLKELLQRQKGNEEQLTRARIQQLEAQLPLPLPMLCSIKNDPQQVSAIHVLRRGNPALPGERVDMRPLGVLSPGDAQPLASNVANPRTWLANWLTDPQHPLTARVLVNRIWQQHFGSGLVRTANDFGHNGSRPSHPELLDYLASMFREGDWSIKSLHRMILLSSTFRQSSRSNPNSLAAATDPDNHWLWHYPRRRLSAEEIRDAMLAISGRLNNKAGGESIMVPVDQELINQLYKPSQWQVTENSSEHDRRSVYLLAKRNLRLPFMEVFDQPTAQTSCPKREQSTHAPQSLELLNGRLSNELAAAFANRLRAESGEDVGNQVDRAYELVAGRLPSNVEREIAAKFIREVSLDEFGLAMFNLNAFLYVD